MRSKITPIAALVAGVFTVFAAWLFWLSKVPTFFPDAKDPLSPGTFGDMFGAFHIFVAHKTDDGFAVTQDEGDTAVIFGDILRCNRRAQQPSVTAPLVNVRFRAPEPVAPYRLAPGKAIRRSRRKNEARAVPSIFRAPMNGEPRSVALGCSVETHS